MFGQLAVLPECPAAPGVPAGAVAPVDDEPEEVLVLGVVVELVAAFAATAPPAISAPDTARTAAAFRMGCMLLTSSRCSLAEYQ